MPGFKAEVKVGKDPYCGNQLVFATQEEADDYGQDLFSRWTAVNEYRVTPTDKEPNYSFVNGQLTRKGE